MVVAHTCLANHRIALLNYSRRLIMWWAIARFVVVLVASYFLNQALAKKHNNKVNAATFDDFDYPQPTEGTPQCVFFGDCWTADWFVLAYGNYRYEAIRK